MTPSVVTGHSATSLGPHRGLQPQRRKRETENGGGERGRRQEEERGAVGWSGGPRGASQALWGHLNPGVASSRAGAGLPLVSSLISTPRGVYAHFHFTAGKIELREEICKVHSADPQQRLRHQSLCVCFLLSSLASALYLWSGAHSHDPVPPCQAGPCLLQEHTWPCFRPQICPGKSSLTARVTGTSQGERARLASSEEGRAEQRLQRGKSWGSQASKR